MKRKATATTERSSITTANAKARAPRPVHSIVGQKDHGTGFRLIHAGLWFFLSSAFEIFGFVVNKQH
jgi:hypothetical protein